jgi:CubicO group peptidase (beta-lactamase class C family)
MTQAARELETYLRKLAAAEQFSGAVLLADRGTPLVYQAYGLASRAFGVANRPDTKFNLGSMNKMFTGVAVTRLAQEGKLAFSDRLIAHLPDYPHAGVARQVTLHQLLTHTSGLGDYFTREFVSASKDRFRTVEDFLPLFVNQPPAFAPGWRFRYSNAGYMVLGAVIERISGQSYFNHVRQHIYQPAGMTDTDAYETDHDTPNLAVGYTQEADDSGRPGAGLRNNLFLHVVKGGPAGGGYSTVADLVRFAEAMRQNRLLDERHTALVLDGKVDRGKDKGGGRYGYGFTDERYRGTRIVGHAGGFAGISGQLDLYMDKGYTLAVLANCDPPAARLVADKVRELVTPAEGRPRMGTEEHG